MKNKFELGGRVNVGFMKNLTVIAVHDEKRDWEAPHYVLLSPKGVQYVFTPHLGLSRIDQYNTLYCHTVGQ